MWLSLEGGSLKTWLSPNEIWPWSNLTVTFSEEIRTQTHTHRDSHVGTQGRQRLHAQERGLWGASPADTSTLGFQSSGPREKNAGCLSDRARGSLLWQPEQVGVWYNASRYIYKHYLSPTPRAQALLCHTYVTCPDFAGLTHHLRLWPGVGAEPRSQAEVSVSIPKSTL